MPDGSSVNNRPWSHILSIQIATDGTLKNNRALRLLRDTVRSYSGALRFGQVLQAAVLSASVVAYAQGTRELTIQESHELVMAAMPESVKQLPKFGLEDSTMPGEARFFFMQAVWDNPSGSVVYGSYAVDKVTGDVWSGVMCREEKSRRLRTA